MANPTARHTRIFRLEIVTQPTIVSPSSLFYHFSLSDDQKTLQASLLLFGRLHPKPFLRSMHAAAESPPTLARSSSDNTFPFAAELQLNDYKDIFSLTTYIATESEPSWPPTRRRCISRLWGHPGPMTTCMVSQRHRKTLQQLCIRFRSIIQLYPSHTYTHVQTLTSQWVVNRTMPRRHSKHTPASTGL